MDTSTYFEHIVENLDSQEINILQILVRENATAKYKALSNLKLIQMSELSEAKFRTVITRLNAVRFVEVNAASKVHAHYINGFGLKALSMLEE